MVAVIGRHGQTNSSSWRRAAVRFQFALSLGLGSLGIAPSDGPEALARRFVLSGDGPSSDGDWETLLEALPPAEALELTRRLPRPLPAGRAAALIEEMGRGRVDDQWRLERVATAPIPEAQARLGALTRTALEGRLDPALAAAVAALQGNVGSAADLPSLFEASRRREPDWAGCARQAFDRLSALELLDGRGKSVSTLLLEYASRHPELPWTRIDAACAASAGGDLARADQLFTEAFSAAPDAIGTTALELRSSALAGRAWMALLSGESERAAGFAAAAARFPRQLLDHEDALRIASLRAQLLSELIATCAGSAEPVDLAARFREFPVDLERCFLDEAWFGTFGPEFGAAGLIRNGKGDALLAFAERCVTAIDASDARHGHGSLPLSGGPDEEALHERVASSIFLRAAELARNVAGDPKRALRWLDPRVARLEQSPLWLNQECLIELHLFAARCHRDDGDDDGARKELDTALRAATAIAEGAARDWLARLGRDEAPTPPIGRVVLRADPPYAALVARIRLERSGFLASAVGDTRGAAEELFAAGGALPWDSDRWLQCAVDFARRGRSDDARRCLARVEAIPLRSYDLARVFAQLGERDAAFAQLATYLARRAVTPRGRALDLAGMRRDRDLAPLLDDPRFPRE